MKIKDFLKFIDKRIANKRASGRHSTADIYRAAGNRFKHFCEKKATDSITPSLMSDFYDDLKDTALKPNTIVSYLSALRAIYNMALQDKLIKKDMKPFAGLKLKPEITVKTVILPCVIEEIANLDLSQKPELQLAADINSFSFMACGIPFVDLVRLTCKNIKGNQLVYNRHKTGTRVCIQITQGMQQLIDQYKNNSSPFLFPLLKSEEVGHEEYKRLLHYQNDCLCTIGKLLTVPQKLTSYTARRCWAMEAYRLHVPITLISQALGHTSEKTTRYYLATLDPSELFEANEKIVKKIDDLIMKKVG